MKHLFTWISLSLCCVAMSATAQEEVTTQFILNPSFENGTTDWTVKDLSPMDNTFFEKDGKYYLEKWTGTSSSVGSASATQDLSFLPAGNYRLTARAQNINQDNSDVQTGAVIFAGSNSTTVTVSNTYSVEFTTGHSVSIGFRATNASGNWPVLFEW